MNIVGRSKIETSLNKTMHCYGTSQWCQAGEKRKEKREKLGLGDDARSLYSSAAKAKL